MRHCLLTIAVVGLLGSTSSIRAGHPSYSYPKVRTFSGGYYGPTQAHYQYQRRYGRPWHGYGGLTSYGVGYNGGGFYGAGFSGYRSGWPTYPYAGFGYGYGAPYALGGYGYSYYRGSSFLAPGCGLFGFGASPIVSYPLGLAVAAPSLVLESPGVYAPGWSANPSVNDALLNNGLLWQQEVPDLITPQVETLDVEPLGKAEVLPPPSTPQAQLRSLQQQQQGDARLRQLDYLQAYLRYKEAVDSAAERVEPHYRMGISLAGMKRFDKAVRELKLASELDFTWVNSVSLDELLGDDNQIGKVQLKQRVADWALADAYDADRLYLLGTLLYLDGDRDRARILFDTAVALVGNEQHLTAYLAAPPEPAATDQTVPVPPAPQIDELPAAPSDPPSQVPEQTEGAPPSIANPVLPSVSVPSGPVFPSEFN